MRTVLLLSTLLCAALAAPAEDPAAPEAAVESPVEAVAVAEDPVPEDNPVSEDAAPAARFNVCPDKSWSFSSDSGRCYKFIDSPMTWHNAEEHCNGLGGHLASVTNPKDYQLVQQLTQDKRQSFAWLGGFNLQGRWMWIDRKGFYYTNWGSSSSSTSRPCIFLRTTSGWGNSGCTSGYHFVCSLNPFKC